MTPDQLVETGLVEGQLAPGQGLDLVGVDVDAEHVPAGLGQPGRMRGPRYPVPTTVSCIAMAPPLAVAAA